jgi:phage FluMu gp28-like protein
VGAKAYSLAASEVNEFVFEDEDELGEKRGIKAFRIDFASGHKVLALSSRPRSIRGKQGKVTIDEAGYHDDLPASSRPRWRCSSGAARSRSSRRTTARTTLQRARARHRAGKLPYAMHSTTFREAMADGLYQRVCLKKGETWSRRRAQVGREIYA